MHAYLPVNRMSTLDAALTLARLLTEIWAVDETDVAQARALCERHRGLGARDLIHFACCQRRGVSEIKTLDRALASVFD
jgi:uncharacterized protein